MRAALLATGVGLLLAATAAAQPAIDVALSPAELTLGDHVELVVTVTGVEASDSIEVRFQQWADTLGPAEILEIGPVERETGADGGTVYRQRLTLTLFQLGEVVLPPVEAFVSGPQGDIPLTSVSSRATVASVLPDEAEDPEARPPAPPRRLGLGQSFWWSTGALLATCLVAIVALWRQSNGLDPGESGSARLTPIEELRRALATLESQSDMVPFHAGLSLAVRRFLGRSLEFPAPESTTTEVRRALVERSLSPDLVRDATQLLSSCDMVKFARQDVEPTTAMHRAAAAKSVGSRVLRAITPGAADGPNDHEDDPAASIGDKS